MNNKAFTVADFGVSNLSDTLISDTLTVADFTVANFSDTVKSATPISLITVNLKP